MGLNSLQNIARHKLKDVFSILFTAEGGKQRCIFGVGRISGRYHHAKIQSSQIN